MWKNIAIVIVALLIIREINLMNGSLTISPDTKKVISDDHTIISYVISFIKQEKALFFKESSTPMTKKPKKKKLPTLDEVQPVLSNRVTLQDIESNNTAALPKQIIKKQETKPLFARKRKKPINLEIIEKKEKTLNKISALPTSYQSAEDKVFAILHEMGKR